MTTPLFPSLQPPVVDPNWFSCDKPVDEDAELAQLEKEHQNWIQEIAQKDCDLVPTGQIDAATFEDEEEEDDDNDDDDEESESNDDDDDEEIEVDDLAFNPDPVVNLT